MLYKLLNDAHDNNDGVQALLLYELQDDSPDNDILANQDALSVARELGRPNSTRSEAQGENEYRERRRTTSRIADQ